jgi:S-adenosylmethionine:tRNA ribosyltransferase-isomerase
VRYQTVFAKHDGSVAAPTAGLHITEAMLAAFRARNIEVHAITLHVGLGTFQPVTVDDLDQHPMHSELYHVPEDTRAAVANAKAEHRPVVAIGTTVVRALESVAQTGAASGETRLLIQPGFTFQVVDRLLTNFHLPESTLLSLVCAFGGTDTVLSAYRTATEMRYRFFSYGDAMLVQRVP